MNNKPAFKPGSNIATAVVGAILILVGILFLIGRVVSAVFDFDLGHFAWPFFIIIPGVILFLASFTFEQRAGIPVAMFGGMVTMAGGILLFQNIFDLYASWAYAWALIAPTSVGLSKIIYGSLRSFGDEVKSGLSLTGIGLSIFVVGAFFFELIIGINGFGFGVNWQCWPVLLIGLGVVLLFSNLLPRRNPPSA